MGRENHHALAVSSKKDLAIESSVAEWKIEFVGNRSVKADGARTFLSASACDCRRGLANSQAVDCANAKADSNVRAPSAFTDRLRLMC